MAKSQGILVFTLAEGTLSLDLGLGGLSVGSLRVSLRGDRNNQRNTGAELSPDLLADASYFMVDGA